MKSTGSEFSRRRAATYIACAVIVSVGVPFSAYAASAFTIADPVHPSYQARVASTGRLLTDASGSRVGVTGIVRAQWGQPWSGSCSAARQCSIVLPAGHTIDIRTLALDEICPGNPYDVVSVAGSKVGADGPVYIAVSSSTAGGAEYTGTTQVDMPITVSAAGTGLLQVATPGCQNVALTAYGYLS